MRLRQSKPFLPRFPKVFRSEPVDGKTAGKRERSESLTLDLRRTRRPRPHNWNAKRLGHGRLCDEADVTEYRDMITIIRDRVAELVKKGKSLSEVQSAQVTLDYDGRYSQPTWTGEMFVASIYNSLKPTGSE